jgi:hypothetical protein
MADLLASGDGEPPRISMRSGTPATGGSAFPTTQRSAIAGLKSPDPTERAHAFRRIIACYWKPVYKYVRVKWRMIPADAQDVTQAFFTIALEKDTLAKHDPSRARFRRYLRVCLDHFTSRYRRSEATLPAAEEAIDGHDFEEVEAELARAGQPAADALDDYFDAEWVRHVFGLAVATLRDECAAKGKDEHFRIFERYDLDPSEGKPTHAALAAELGIGAMDVSNRLSFARREFRRIVLDTLQAITATEDEFRAEARVLLGVDL